MAAKATKKVAPPPPQKGPPDGVTVRGYRLLKEGSRARIATEVIIDGKTVRLPKRYPALEAIALARKKLGRES